MGTRTFYSPYIIGCRKKNAITVLLERIPQTFGRPSVIPAQAGNQGNGIHAARLDSGFRRNDKKYAGMTKSMPECQKVRRNDENKSNLMREGL